MSQEQMDLLLYAWLSEPNAQRAESKFTAYFRVAFPAMCRYVRSFRTTPEVAEDIAQRSLIKLFSHLGVKRQAAGARVRAALEMLRPLAWGELHASRVTAWRQQVAAIVEAPFGFVTPGGSGALCIDWKELREDTNGGIEPLTRQGYALLSEVKRRLGPQLTQMRVREPGLPDEPPVQTDRAVDEVAAEARHFTLILLALADSEGDAIVDHELNCPGAVGFVRSTSTVCDDLPSLAVPSNALLFTISKRAFLDWLRGARADARRHVDVPAMDEGATLLDALDLEPLTGCGTWSGEELPAVAPTVTSTADVDDENAELGARYRAFLDSLRTPLTRAEGVLAEASLRGRATAERARVAALAAKYARLLAVLRALRESPQPSEQAIGARLGLTRNQVKYAIETIREEFSRCLPHLAGDARGRRKRQRVESS